jgi:hypothetical protein
MDWPGISCVSSIKNHWHHRINPMYFESYDEFVRKLHFKSSRTSEGRLKIDFKTEYLIIERQALDLLNPSYIDDLVFELMY